MLAFQLCFISHVNIVLSDMLDLRSPYKQSAGLFVPAMCACAYILARSPSNPTAIRYMIEKEPSYGRLLILYGGSGGIRTHEPVRTT